MNQRNAPALGLTFEQAKAAGLWSGQSREHYAKALEMSHRVKLLETKGIIK